jgi:hypothetical protein
VIDLTEMAEPVNSALADGTPCLVATAGGDGMPDIAYKGSTMVYDTEHLAFWERSIGQTLTNLTENPHACVLYRNPARGVAWRFYGAAELYREGETRDAVMARTVKAELDRDPERKGVAVVLRVDRVVVGRNVVQSRE